MYKKWILRETGCGDVDWFFLAQNRIQRRVLANIPLKLWSQKFAEIFTS
jgi:hypothetical protein